MRRASPSRQEPRRDRPAPRKVSIPKLGKRGRQWAATRARLKVRFERAGLTRCELCGSDNALGFAHRRKRRDITTQAELETVALLCNACHDQQEGKGSVIDGIIAARETPI